MKAYHSLTTVLIASLVVSAGAGVTITGIVDGPLSGGLPKAIELYVDGSVDFTNFDLYKSSNGGAFGAAGDMSGLGTVSDSFVYLIGGGASGLTNFQNVFGTSGDFANTFSMGNANGNGDDGFQIVDASSTVLDQVWQSNTSDSYRDSYLYRMDGTGPEGATWTAANWLIPGNDTLDGMNEMQISAAVPFGTYQVPAPGAIALLTMSGLISTRRRRA